MRFCEFKQKVRKTPLFGGEVAFKYGNSLGLLQNDSRKSDTCDSCNQPKNKLFLPQNFMPFFFVNT